MLTGVALSEPVLNVIDSLLCLMESYASLKICLQIVMLDEGF